MESLVMAWLASVAKDAPILFGAALVLWDLRNQLVSCIEKSQRIMDKLLDKELQS